MPAAAAHAHVCPPDYLPVPPLLGVDDDECLAHVPLPEPFTRPDLADDQVSTQRARDTLETIIRAIGDALYALEPIERALRVAEPDSPLAAEMRRHVRSALAGQEAAMIGLDHADLALHRAAPGPNR